MYENWEGGRREGEVLKDGQNPLLWSLRILQTVSDSFFSANLVSVFFHSSKEIQKEKKLLFCVVCAVLSFSPAS